MIHRSSLFRPSPRYNVPKANFSERTWPSRTRPKLGLSSNKSTHKGRRPSSQTQLLKLQKNYIIRSFIEDMHTNLRILGFIPTLEEGSAFPNLDLTVGRKLSETQLQKIDGSSDKNKDDKIRN